MIRMVTILLLFMGSCFFAYSQQHIDTTTQLNDSSLLIGKGFSTKEKVLNVLDTTLSILKLKDKIVPFYKKVESSNQKYIDKYKELKQDVSSKFDSMKYADTSKSTFTQVLQKVISPKSQNEKQKNINKQESSLQHQIEKENLAIDHINKGAIKLNENKTEEAILHYQMGLRIAQETGSQELIEYALKGLSEAYMQKTDMKKALFYYQQYTGMRDSLFKAKANYALNEIKSREELEKKQQEIQSLVLEGEEKKSALEQMQAYVKKQKQYIILIALVLFLSVVLTVVLFRQNRLKKKTNEILWIQNNKIAEQKSELEKSLAYTKQLQEALREDLDHYMQLALRKQMNPHFIFNALNSIQSFILQNDKLTANIYLSKFASLMRKVLENSQYQTVPLEKEIEVLRLYIELEEQRFDNTFSCVWKIAGELDFSDYKIPPLLMQPYIENAIWHGLLHKEGDKLLLIEITSKEDLLVCSIEDNGIGRVAAMALGKNKVNHESLGTKITQKRIDLLNSLNQDGIGVLYVDLKNNKGDYCGTRVELSIPIRN